MVPRVIQPSRATAFFGAYAGHNSTSGFVTMGKITMEIKQTEAYVTNSWLIAADL